MPLVIGVFEPADHRCGRADQLGELFLGEPCLGPKVANLSGQLGVDQLLLE